MLAVHQAEMSGARASEHYVSGLGVLPQMLKLACVVVTFCRKRDDCGSCIFVGQLGYQLSFGGNEVDGNLLDMVDREAGVRGTQAYCCR